jgi:hypothetical protein
VGAPQQLQQDLTLAVERCAAALHDLPRLRDEVTSLKQVGDGPAHFASALFELELARQGDVQSRLNITALAEVLLVFWSNGSGDELARLHPALEAQWAAVAPMLVQFEMRRLEMALGKCWKHRGDPGQLAVDLEALQPPGNRRVEFARCLYHLELARQGVQSSRAEFARRAGLLAEAYQDASFAKDLVGADAGLTQLWGDLKPYLDEFFEAMEEQAARAMDGTRKVPMPTAPPPEPEPPARADVATDPSMTAQVPALPPEDEGPALGDPLPTPRGGNVAIAPPTPRAQPAIAAAFGVSALEGDPDLDEPRPSDVTVRAPLPIGLLAVEEPVAPAPPPPAPPPPPRIAPAIPPRPAPSHGPEVPSFSSLFNTPPPAAPAARASDPGPLTPPGGPAPELELVFDLGEEPPPPSPRTPPAGTFAAADEVPLELAVEPAPAKPSSKDEIEIVEADFEAPAGPPPPPPAALAPATSPPAPVAEDIDVDFEPEETTLNFWDYTFASLQQAPVEGVKPRMLASESRPDRKRLTTWLDGLGPHLAVPEAKAMGALVRLMLAGETKEKSLFGQANPRRKEALQAAFAMLSPHPAAVGKVAEWFVLDGAETEAALMRGLELLYPFLTFCARHALDPLQPEAVAAYLEQA